MSLQAARYYPLENAQHPGSGNRSSLEPATRSRDWLLASCVLILIGLGVLMVYSATAIISDANQGDSAAFLKKHIVHVLISLGVLFVCSRATPDLLMKAAPWGLLCSFIMLFAVLIPGVGVVAGGARRWIDLGLFRLQPAELVKLFVVVYTSSFLFRHAGKLRSFLRGIIIPFCVVVSLVGLLLLQPDFGSSAVILAVVFCQLLVGGSRLLHLGFVVVGAVLTLGTLIATSPYRMRRFEAFLNPFDDASGAGYQLIQSLIAIGSGGLAGMGLGSGQQKLFYLPAAHTDFIFAVLGEELGFVGCMGVLLLFAVIGFRGLRHAIRLAHCPHLSSLVAGLTILLVLPALLNVGVVTGALPTKGMVLPFLGYGGTAMSVSCATAGLLLALSKVEGQQ